MVPLILIHLLVVHLISMNEIINETKLLTFYNLHVNKLQKNSLLVMNLVVNHSMIQKIVLLHQYPNYFVRIVLTLHE